MGERVIEEIEATVARAVDRDLTPQAVERAKRILTSDFAFDNETGSSISGTLAEFELLFGGAERFADYLTGVERTTAEECVRAIREFFSPERRLTVVIEPDGTARSGDGLVEDGAGGGGADETVGAPALRDRRRR